MKRLNVFSMFVLGIVMFLFLPVRPSFAACPVNMAQVGPICVDKYEASVWSQKPDANGNPKGTQFGIKPGKDNYPCSDNGNDCTKNKAGKIFAVSAPGEIPSGYITWFQAQQACFNVGKRLLRNDEWQAAAAGTRDENSIGVRLCHASTASLDLMPTGSHPNCVSNWGVFDMVGNIWEWVGDWMQDNSDDNGADYRSTPLYGNDGIDGIDEAYPEEDGFPAVLSRGGGARNIYSDIGIFALDATNAPSYSSDDIGFRCAK